VQLDEAVQTVAGFCVFAAIAATGSRRGAEEQIRVNQEYERRFRESHQKAGALLEELRRRQEAPDRHAL
jgi:hypothetical protein